MLKSNIKGGESLGLFLKKIIKLGFFNINLSNTGIGVSLGINGFRISRNSKGTYINIGKNGFYYRKKLTNTNNKENINEKLKDIEVNKGFSKISHKSMEEELNENLKPTLLIEIIKKMLVLAAIYFFLELKFFIAITIYIIFYAVKYNYDSKKIINMNYELDDKKREAFNTLNESMRLLSFGTKIWNIENYVYSENWKENAGATNLLKREKINCIQDNSKYIRANLLFFSFIMRKQEVNFLPDSIYLYENDKYTIIKYENVNIIFKESIFIENEEVPTDAKIIEYVWKHPNRNGEPDKRYSNNYRLPVMKYGGIIMEYDKVRQIIIQFSSFEKAKNFVEKFDKYKINK